MSGKPASVGASRAGVPATPRVLVYVADPRQLESGAAAPDPPPAASAPVHPPQLDNLYIPDNLHHQVNLPRNTIYRTQIDRSDQRNLPATFFYKPLIDNDGKVSGYGTPENVSQRTDYYPGGHQYVQETGFKNEENRRDGLGIVKQDCSEVGTEFSSVETFQHRIPVEATELAPYHTRCISGSEHTMNSVLPAVLRNGQNRYNENLTAQNRSEVSNCNERELSMCKSFVNYQFLEQSVSHQSIVNQSISILNQQVGVSKGVGSEGESGSVPQLVRTPDGVLLAVLPAPALPHQADISEPSSRTLVQSDSLQTITVPLGWKRIINGSSVLYISPSGTALSTLPQLRDYLQTTGTCKCGLPCPLRPETAFSFDSKVGSKAYQAPSGAELTKLCNHKRKLLTTLQARAQSPSTPPPQNIDPKKVMGTEIAVLKKKMKKRPAFPANVAMSQLTVQRERPLNETKAQDLDSNRDLLTKDLQRPNSAQPCPPGYPLMQQNLNPLTLDPDIKQETQVQRSSHYLTVNSGWISQHSQQMESIESGQKRNFPPASGVNNPISMGTPVLGTNGQIIGVNTGFNKQLNSYKNMSMISSCLPEQEQKDENKDLIPVQSQGEKCQYKDESQIFCGLNQPLTPEVMQKINEQQQIFIQQNQKQIELAMKGYRTQLAETVNQNKSQGQAQYIPQAQLVIHNGAVVKTNPAKTPPWQVKRNEPSTSKSMTSPNPKLQKMDCEYEDSNTSISEDSSSSYNSFSNDHNQGMCPRVPPLPQHYNIMSQQWPAVDTNKKKSKAGNNRGNKKKNSPESKLPAFNNNGMRLLNEPKSMDESSSNNVPSFMDDPNGYLAQQTVLLNNTISKQVGIHSTYDINQYDSANSGNCSLAQIDKFKSLSKSNDLSQTYRNVSNPSLSPANTPDSSMISDRGIDPSVPQCCQGCVVAKSSSPDYTDNQMRLKYMKHHMYKMEIDTTCSPRHRFEDNPVTSSTFVDRSPIVNDSCGPIQAATVSTSNVSLTETLQPPEPSPTFSNSSRSTDTPHSNGSNSSQMQSNCTYPMQSPAYSSSGSCRDSYGSNPSTPGSQQGYLFHSPGPPNCNQSLTGNQVMHFISNHNVNKNLMEVDNISMVGVKPASKPHPQDAFRMDRRRLENNMPGYCPPPHLGGGPAHSLIQACYVQTFVTTMASGFSVTRDTVTSVLAGKANTATTSINAAQANLIRPPPPPSVNLATTYAIPNNQPDPFINAVNLPTSYPLHIAGTTAQNMISKSPLEMVQNVIGTLPSKPESNNTHTPALSQLSRRSCSTPGQILISSTGQIIVSNNQMPPPPPKASTSIASIAVTNVTTSVAQVVPSVGGINPLSNQPTVVVNTLPAPFVIQSPMMAVDGQVVQQNSVLPQIVTGGIVPGQSPTGSPRQIDMKSAQSFVQSVTMLSPESLKKRNKKKKNGANITSVLQIAAPQQNSNNIMVHHSPQHNSGSQFSPRSFQLSPNNNISPTPVLQALTIVPGKSGTSAHIVMNGQGNGSGFGSQQIITNGSPSQQINLLQPVNLINNTSGVVSNFPAFQQFIVPNLGGMVMTADGTALIQDNSNGMPVQLQLQTVNGQNVLTPVQSPNVFTAGANGGVVIRAQSQQGKIVQSQHSPGAQFLSPSGQLVLNGPNFNGQLSPLLANLSPTNVTFNPGPQARASGQCHEPGGRPRGARAVPPSAKRAAPRVQRAGSGSSGGAGSAGSAESAEARHSVSTQTRAGGKSPGARCSPPDTTTHSPLGAEPDTRADLPDTDAADASAMVQCVSSSEQDIADSREQVWPVTRNEFNSEIDTQNKMSNTAILRQSRPLNPVESTDVLYSSNMSVSLSNQQTISMTSNHYERTLSYKRKNDFGDTSTYRSDKVLRTGTYNIIHGIQKDNEYDNMGMISMEKTQSRHYSSSGSSTDTSMPNIFDRHNVGPGGEGERRLEVGDVVWGPCGAHASWPAQLRARLPRAACLVRWFGAPPAARARLARLPAADLLSLSEGLEAHHAASTAHRKSRKLNALLENAIQEAMAALDRRSARAAGRTVPSPDSEGPADVDVHVESDGGLRADVGPAADVDACDTEECDERRERKLKRSSRSRGGAARRVTRRRKRSAARRAESR